MQKYVVGFDIADGRNLSTEDGQPCDPFVVVECCGKRYQTETKIQKAPHVPWNETNIWADIELYPEEFESAYIEFSVFAKHWFSRNFLIGKASLQLTSINRRTAHVYAKKSVPLRREGCTENTGSINLTVFCLRPGESAPNYMDNSLAFGEGGDGEEENFDDLSKVVLGSVEVVQGSSYYVIINIYRVEDLAKIGWGNPNPFITVEFASACVATIPAYDVEQYTWNESVKIPVQTPVFEDTILVKLWHKGSALTLSADKLLAQGLISFSELRNNALKETWFCLYGWDPEEVPDVKEISKTGENIRPNYFQGRLLISGRVERLGEEETMTPACLKPFRAPMEPSMMRVALLADVYEVRGAVGRECQVQISFGKHHKETKDWVTPRRIDKSAASYTKQDSDEILDDAAQPEHEEVTSFWFSQTLGRVEPLVVMAPEDVESQPYVMVNVYTRGILSGRLRCGYQMRRLYEFPRYDPGSPVKPRFIPLEPMPYTTNQRNAAAVLMTIEEYNTDDVPRHNRKDVKPMLYIVRAYVFMGRNIKTEQVMNYAVRVACAGMSVSTEATKKEVRPMWMKCIELKVTLLSDHKKEPPTMEPITVSICHQQYVLGIRQETPIGKTVCTYEYMRTKDNMGKWEPYRLQPQWIQLFGGTYGTKVTGEVLIAFELLHATFRRELEPKVMWPVNPDEYNKQKHFSQLKKATLHFAIFGLRDLVMGRGSEQQAPSVSVRVKKFAEATSDGKYYEMLFDFEDGTSENKDDKLQSFQTDSLGHQGCWNYEFFQVQKIGIKVPDKAILEPFVAVRVHEKPSGLQAMGHAMSTKLYGKEGRERQEGQLIGEHRRSLGTKYPCAWYDGVDPHGGYLAQEVQIERSVRDARREAVAKVKFEEESAEVRAKEMQEERDKDMQLQLADMKAPIRLAEEQAEAVDSAGLPLELRTFRLKTNELGYKPHERMHLTLKSGAQENPKLNMFKAKSFATKFGEKVATTGADFGQLVVEGKLEESTKAHVFQPDFWFKNAPLLRNHDIIDPDADDTDWHFAHGKCFGFVKFAFKLTSGWEEDEHQDEFEDGDDGGLERHESGNQHHAHKSGKSKDRGRARRAVEGSVEGAPHAVQDRMADSMEMFDTGLAEGFNKACEIMEYVGEQVEDALLEIGEEVLDQLEGQAESSDDGDGTYNAFLRDSRGKQSGSAGRDPVDKLGRSYGLDNDLNHLLDMENRQTFIEHFKRQVPSRVRVRIYFVKAICIFGKQGGVDPYLGFKLGKNITVSMRNMAQIGTNTPDFYRVEERDVIFPSESRLQVDMCDYQGYQDVIGTKLFGEKLIGSTVIDLEDRWHSKKWTDANSRQKVPVENRPLYNADIPGQNCGTINMWIEMIDSTHAHEKNAQPLRKPPAVEIEVRMVIRGTKNVKIVDGNKTDVKVVVDLDCIEYAGHYPKTQATDTHANSTTGNSVFNWRIVFPRIVMPTKSCALEIRVYDANLFSGDTFIGSVSMDIRRYVEKVARDMDSIKVENADLQITGASPTEEGQAPEESLGSVQFELWVMSQSEAEQKKAGKGREEPNEYPQLFTPTEGRGWADVLVGLEFSIPDLGLMKKLLPLIIFTLLSLVLLRWLGLL